MWDRVTTPPSLDERAHHLRRQVATAVPGSGRRDRRTRARHVPCSRLLGESRPAALPGPAGHDGGTDEDRPLGVAVPPPLRPAGAAGRGPRSIGGLDERSDPLGPCLERGFTRVLGRRRRTKSWTDGVAPAAGGDGRAPHRRADPGAAGLPPTGKAASWGAL